MQPGIDALAAAGCAPVLSEQGPANAVDRPILQQAISRLRPDDTLTVYRLDQLGGSFEQIVENVARVQDCGAGVKSVAEEVDTSLHDPRSIAALFAALVPLKPAVKPALRKNTQRPPNKGGRPPALDSLQRRVLAQLINAGCPVGEIAKLYRVDRSTAYRIAKRDAPPRMRVGGRLK